MMRGDLKAQMRIEAERLASEWASSPRWRATRRSYSALDVIRLRGSIPVDCTLARLGADAADG